MMRIALIGAALLCAAIIGLAAGPGTNRPAGAHGAVAPAACGTPGPWVARSPAPESIGGAGVTGDGTYAYAAGGYSESVGGETNQLARYNPATNTWAGLAPLPRAVQEPSLVYAAGKLYLFGGLYALSDAVNETRIYDIATNTWSTGAPMPDVRYEMGAGVWNGRVYLVGGYRTLNAISVQAQTWEYTIATNSWSVALPAMPQPVGGAGSAVVNGHLYILGGSDNLNNARTQVYDYDIAAAAWAVRPSLPVGVNTPGTAVVNGDIWVFGGGDLNAAAGRPGLRPGRPARPQFLTSITQILDPLANTWSSGPSLTQAREYIGGTSVGPYVIAIGGYNGSHTFTTTEVSTGPVCTPTPVPTSTPVATSTPAASPTPCTAGVYSDVPPGSVFYPYVTDLSQRGAISGYSDCTFRPGLNITRGQVAKIVMVATGYVLVNPPAPSFADVPATSPFYAYVETAYANNIISGYTCGGPGEPCDGQNRPYFRPGLNVTRGQLTKIVVGARRWTVLNPPDPRFADVPGGSAFYVFVETAVGHGIISGYDCGGPGEPCDPQNRKYFRAYSTATRGQAAKIIDLALYSDDPTPTPTATVPATAVATSTTVPQPLGPGGSR
ncbi:MAG TPA: S-layer homology domain-containing protein [Chloroflexia bacterium]|nr:S-layer homology domain-containing protein [Chloroflexia bacterium]